MSENAALEREVQYLHELFFKNNPPPEVVARYVAANQLCLPSPDGSGIVGTIVSRRLDAEAIEVVLRLRHLNPVLTRKIQILFYLVEVRSSYYTYFIGHKAGRLRAWADLFGSAVQTAWKLAKGMYLIRRYGLV